MGLPSGYTQVEYIASSGTQYINTGFNPNQNTRLVIDYSASEAVCVFGAYNSGGFGGCGLQNVNGKHYQYYGSSSGSSSTTFQLNTRTTADWNKNTLIINGTTARTVTASTFQCNYPLFVFALNGYGTIAGQSSMKLYSCRIYDDGTLVRDFIPCTNANGVAGLFDDVNDKFYANAGSGVFAVGAVIEQEISLNLKQNIGGVLKQYKELYENVGGVLKKYIELYENIGGVLVPLMSSAPSVVTYTWKKYRVVQGTQYAPVKSSSTVTVSYPSGDRLYAGNQYTFNAENGRYSITNAQSVTVNNITQSSNKYFASANSSSGSEIHEVVSRSTGMTGGGYGYIFTCYKHTSTVTTGNIKGDYISDVTSADSTAYPDNGIHTDGYWYVKQ